ncbi:protein SHORTAGE IN CHIASMATA 1 homolog isoform X1 [Typha latifolia]|uniref:protein SHORTAGE IN CHIASMATA 1 homolog isoform X1 n=1 Tax=Typha latifolia TaxID=4733 RepID=UPI003C2BD9F6
MRTRFLATDYFFNKSASDALSGFHFLPLPPPPDFFPSDLHFDLVIPFFHVGLDLHLNSDIDGFPIESALYDLLSDVLPSFQHPREMDAGVFESRIQNYLSREEIADLIHEGKEEKTSLSFRSDAPATIALEDVIDIEVEITIPYPHMAAKSICLVENFSSILNDDHEYSSVKDGSPSADAVLKQKVQIPQFEITGDAWEIDDSMYGIEIFKFLLPVVEPWHGSQGEDLMVNAKEFLVSDDMADLFRDIPYEPVSMKSVIDMDLISFKDNILLDESSVIYPTKPDGTCLDLPCSVLLQEVQIMDFPSDDIFEKFINLQTANMDTSDQMFNDDMELVGSLYDSIVSSELALVDETFKSLPTPVFSDDKTMKSQSIIIQDILCAQKPHPLSACDGIYLDWHLLLEDTCNRSICSLYVSMAEEVNICSVTSKTQIDFEQIVDINVDFLDDFQENENSLCCEEVPNELQICVPQADHPSGKAEIAQKQNNENNSANSKERFANASSEKVSSLFESTSQSNDLNFFLDVRRGSTRRRDCANESSRESSCKISTPLTLLKEPFVPSIAPKVNPGQWNIHIHQLILSDNIVNLIDHIYGSYTSILEESTFLRNLFPVEELINISKKKLLELIIVESARPLNDGHKDEVIMEIISLYAIKQLAYFLCFFGVHTAHLYISNLSRNIDNMLGRLRSLESLIGDARMKDEKQLIETHPSLSYTEKILRTNCRLGQKILFVSESIFWLPLTRKLTSMKIKYHEVRNTHVHSTQLDTLDNSCFTNFVLDELLRSDCLLMNFEDIPASFPFNKFSIILEYGGQYSSSRLFSLAPNLDGLPPLHFFHVKMNVQNLHAVLFEDLSPNWKSAQETVLYSTKDLQESPSGKNIIESLTYVPTSDRNSCISSESANRVHASYDNDSGASFPYIVKSNNIESRKPSFPDVIIVVNTQSSEKKMLISRRTSYQRILALEKGGAQVVEREVDLPVDLIFSAAVCLVWYETRAFGGNTTMRTESSSIAMFMESIATNVLMSLSFSFSGCILIFEGESSSLAAVMESSDALYAAAVSLDMNLQLFCSYTPESTDEIILGCIRSVTTLTRGLYPSMPEVETLGESFLTRFPSINPLSAHAILSSGGTLVEFLERSHECRIQAVRKYFLPYESISLFSALCRVGEMGESKSVMTECSSIGSDISSALTRSPRKRKKPASYTVAMPINDDPLYAKSLYQLSDNGLERPPVSLPHQLRTSSNFPDKLRKTGGCIHDQALGGSLGVNSCRVNYGDENDIVKDHIVHEEFGHRVIHHDHSLNEKRGSMADTSSSSWELDSRTKLPFRRSMPSSRLAFSGYSHRAFPTSAEINHDTNSWNPLKDKDLSWDEKIFSEVAISSTKNDIGIMHHEHLRDNISQDYPNSPGYSSKKLPPPYHKDSYRNAYLEQGPSWRKDFFCGIKEKSRVHQQNLKGTTCLNSATRSRNKDTNRKSQSPSIIDRYRYQGRSQVSKELKQTRRKDTKGKPSPDCKKRKNPSFSSPTWTPIDKRARQNLSFARYGNEKQSKLVWRNKRSPGTGGNLRKKYREEGQLNIL